MLPGRYPSSRDETQSDAHANPAIPFFGLIDYKVTRALMRQIVERVPELAGAADQFVRATTAGSPRFAYRNTTDDDQSSDGSAQPSLSIVEEDIRKWSAFAASRQKRLLAFYQGKWVELSTDYGLYDDLLHPFVIEPGSNRKHVLFGDTEMNVRDTLPENWQALPWIKLVMVLDSYEVLGNPEVMALWDPACQAWKHGSEPEIAALGLSGVLDALSEDVHAERYGPAKGVNCVEKPFQLSVRVLYLSRNSIVTEDDGSDGLPVGRVSLAAFKDSLRKYVADSDRVYRGLFESGIRKFANDQLVSTGLQSLDEVVDQILTEYPNSTQAKSYGPEHYGNKGQLGELLRILTTMHGASVAPVDIFKERPVSSFRGPGAERNEPRQPEPTLQLDAADIEALRLAYRQDPKTAFKGAFFRQWEPEFLHSDQEPAETASMVLAQLSNLPTDGVIAAVIKEHPNAEQLLNEWRALWDRSFPGWHDKKRRLDHADRSSRQFDRDWLEKTFDDRYLKELGYEDVASVDFVLRRSTGDEHQNWQGTINDAARAVAMSRMCDPRGGVMMAPTGSHVVGEPDQQGLPMLEDAFEAVSRNLFHYRLLHRKFEYWNWPFLLPHFGVKIARTRDSHTTGLALLDMKLQGYDKAVVTDFQKWENVVLSEGETPNDFERIVKTLFGAGNHHSAAGFFVKEHAKLECDQRFFVVDGRVIGSATIGNNLNALDASPRRLDERVRVSDDDSAVNRQWAATLTRKARHIAADLKANGILECAIDVGIADGRPVLSYLTRIDVAHTGTFDPGRFIAAFQRKRGNLREPLRKDIAARIDTLVAGPQLKSRCLDVLDRNLHQLPAVVERQYDILARNSSKEQHPTNHMQATAVSIVLTALLEMEPELKIGEEAAA